MLKTSKERLFIVSQSVGLKWSLALAWMIMAVALMLSPSGNGSTISGISGVFGGTNITDAIGHVIINTILTLLWCRTLRLYFTVARTARLVLGIGLPWGIGIEVMQHFAPQRGVSLLDLSANLLGLAVGLAIYRRWSAPGSD